MGRVKNNNISGAVGPIVFYEVRGKLFARTKPRKRKKKPSAEVAARNTLFGEITGPSSRMLKQMKEHFIFPIGFDQYNKLRGWMYVLYSANADKPDWEIASDNNMCQLNPLADLRHFFRSNIAVRPKGVKGISVSFDAFNPARELRVPVNTKKVTIKIMIASSPPGLAATHLTKEIYSFDPSVAMLPAMEFVLDTQGATGDIVIAAIAIEFERSVKEDKPDPRWLPAAVIAMGRIKR